MGKGTGNNLHYLYVNACMSNMKVCIHMHEHRVVYIYTQCFADMEYFPNILKELILFTMA